MKNFFFTEPGPRASWDSATQRTTTTDTPSSPRPRPAPLRPFSSFDSTLYSFPATNSAPPVKDKSETYKEISRRLDCKCVHPHLRLLVFVQHNHSQPSPGKTEYIRNLLHDSASITVPLRHSGAMPRNHFNHNKGALVLVG